MTSPTLQALINKATEKATQNAYRWEKSDFSISSQLRKGVRDARVAFKRIDEQEVQHKLNLLVHSQSLLEEMLVALQPVFGYYRSLPGSYGEWECSALGIIEDQIKQLISKKYFPSEIELERAKQELENLKKP